MPPDCIQSSVNDITSDFNKSVSIYPNPFSVSPDIICVNTSLAGNTVLVIYNILGKEISRMVIENKITTLPSDIFTPGIYMFQLTVDNTIVQSGRIIKQL